MDAAGDIMSTEAGKTLKSPFPAFGGKSRIAPLVWARLGTGADSPRNYAEPFCFTAAMLLKRPETGTIETINDRNAFVANFWRAVQQDPDAVARHADWPVNETDLHARHRWLVASSTATALLDKVREDPDFFDARIAGWWCWGACCWIGSGWCDERGVWETRPNLAGDGGGNGVHRVDRQKMPHCDVRGHGRGINGLGEQLPDLSGDSGATGRGVHASGKRVQLAGNGIGRGCTSMPGERRTKLSGRGNGGVGVNSSDHDKRPRLAAFDAPGLSVHGTELDDTHRPQLADEFGRGRGMHGNINAMTCATRRAWITDWMHRLADRLRSVRVCCGHWDRICDSPSTMTRLGIAGVFLDPPYRTELACGKKNRTRHIYANDRNQDINALCDEVEEWCLKWGGDRQVRIALCGLEGEYPKLQELVGPHAGGWDCVAWKSNGGYGNRAGGGENVNASRERVWFSPHCVPAGGYGGLFT